MNGNRSSAPALVFIAGSARSGTTWLARIFDSHPNTFYLHEPDLVVYSSDFPVVPNLDQLSTNIPMAEDFLQRLLRSRPLKAVASRPTFDKTYRNGLARRVREGVIVALRGAEQLAGRRVEAVPVPDMITSTPAEPISFVLKSVNALARLPLYAAARPDMPIIHILRHPCGVAASGLRGIKSGKMRKSRIFKGVLALPPAQRRGLDEETVQSLSPLQARMWSWVILNEWAMEQKPPNCNWHTLRYEDLCAAPLEESKKLFAACGLSWQKQTEDFLRQGMEAGNTDEYFSVIRNPSEPMNRWRKELSAQEIEEVAAITADSLPGKLYADTLNA